VRTWSSEIESQQGQQQIVTPKHDMELSMGFGLSL
jgi:hypothetical protein